MAGLLEKDFRLLMQRKQILLLFAVISAIIAFSQDDTDGTFILSYISACTAITLVTTITYDEADNGYQFLMTLPISPKIYVQEKYLFCVVGTTIAWSLSVIAYFILKTAHGEYFYFLEELPFVAVFLFVVFVILSILIPIQLKYGAEKGRLVLAVLMGVVFAVIYVIAKIAKKNPEVSKVLKRMDSVNDTIIIAVIAGAGILIMLLSYGISRRIMEKKEF